MASVSKRPSQAGPLAPEDEDGYMQSFLQSYLTVPATQPDQGNKRQVTSQTGGGSDSVAHGPGLSNSTGANSLGGLNWHGEGQAPPMQLNPLSMNHQEGSDQGMPQSYTKYSLSGQPAGNVGNYSDLQQYGRPLAPWQQQQLHMNGLESNLDFASGREPTPSLDLSQRLQNPPHQQFSTFGSSAKPTATAGRHTLDMGIHGSRHRPFADMLASMGQPDLQNLIMSELLPLADPSQGSDFLLSFQTDLPDRQSHQYQQQYQQAPHLSRMSGNNPRGSSQEHSNALKRSNSDFSQSDMRQLQLHQQQLQQQQQQQQQRASLSRNNGSTSLSVDGGPIVQQLQQQTQQQQPQQRASPHRTYSSRAASVHMPANFLEQGSGLDVGVRASIFNTQSGSNQARFSGGGSGGDLRQLQGTDCGAGDLGAAFTAFGRRSATEDGRSDPNSWMGPTMQQQQQLQQQQKQSWQGGAGGLGAAGYQLSTISSGVVLQAQQPQQQQRMQGAYFGDAWQQDPSQVQPPVGSNSIFDFVPGMNNSNLNNSGAAFIQQDVSGVFRMHAISDSQVISPWNQTPGTSGPMLAAAAAMAGGGARGKVLKNLNGSKAGRKTMSLSGSAAANEGDGDIMMLDHSLLTRNGSAPVKNKSTFSNDPPWIKQEASIFGGGMDVLPRLKTKAGLVRHGSGTVMHGEDSESDTPDAAGVMDNASPHSNSTPRLDLSGKPRGRIKSQTFKGEAPLGKGVGCSSQERNRTAQRRFRMRQKQKMGELEDIVETLKCEMQRDKEQHDAMCVTNGMLEQLLRLREAHINTLQEATESFQTMRLNQTPGTSTFQTTEHSTPAQGLPQPTPGPSTSSPAHAPLAGDRTRLNGRSTAEAQPSETDDTYRLPDTFLTSLPGSDPDLLLAHALPPPSNLRGATHTVGQTAAATAAGGVSTVVVHSSGCAALLAVGTFPSSENTSRSGSLNSTGGGMNCSCSTAACEVVRGDGRGMSPPAASLGKLFSVDQINGMSTDDMVDIWCTHLQQLKDNVALLDSCPPGPRHDELQAMVCGVVCAMHEMVHKTVVLQPLVAKRFMSWHLGRREPVEHAPTSLAHWDSVLQAVEPSPAQEGALIAAKDRYLTKYTEIMRDRSHLVSVLASYPTSCQTLGTIHTVSLGWREAWEAIRQSIMTEHNAGYDFTVFCSQEVFDPLQGARAALLSYPFYPDNLALAHAAEARQQHGQQQQQQHSFSNRSGAATTAADEAMTD